MPYSRPRSVMRPAGANGQLNAAANALLAAAAALNLHNMQNGRRRK